jgi:hypothetical protein
MRDEVLEETQQRQNRASIGPSRSVRSLPVLSGLNYACERNAEAAKDLPSTIE